MKGTELKRELGLFSAISLVVGTIIGSGVFFKPQAIFAVTGAPGLGIIAWVLAGIISIAGGLTTAELAASIAVTGGMVVWLGEAFGQLWAFLLGWDETIVFFPAYIAAIATVFGTQACALLGLSMSYARLISIICITFLIGMNCLGAKIPSILKGEAGL